MALASSGIGSNIDVNTIVSGLMTAEQRPLTLLTQRKRAIRRS
jgi:flagellar hook-associated protein 2